MSEALRVLIMFSTMAQMAGVALDSEGTNWQRIR